MAKVIIKDFFILVIKQHFLSLYAIVTALIQLILILRKTLFTSQPLRLKHIKFIDCVRAQTIIASPSNQTNQILHENNLVSKNNLLPASPGSIVTDLFRYFLSGCI